MLTKDQVAFFRIRDTCSWRGSSLVGAIVLLLIARLVTQGHGVGTRGM